MSPTTEDPRNYIEIKPIPEWKEATDSKLKARNLQNYTLERPTREDVFKSNYARRLKRRKDFQIKAKPEFEDNKRFSQQHAQGYNSAPWQPYQEVGRPLYLNAKAMVQGSLGQEARILETKSLKSGSSSSRQLNTKNESDSGEKFKKSRPKSARLSQEAKQIERRPTSAVTFAMKNKQRQKEEHQSIVKDLNVLKTSLTKVKMGLPLFSTLESSSKSPSDDIEIKQVGKMALNVGESRRPSSVSFKDMAFNSSSRRPSLASITSSGSAAPNLVARQAKIEKSAAEQARPFTPVHSNISLSVELDAPDESIWRQLCALHWVLQACQLETKSEIQRQHKVMIPISECWDSINPGGKTRDIRSVLEEKKNNTKWTKFTRTGALKLGGNRSRGRRKNTSYSYRASSTTVGGLRKVPSYASDMTSLRKSASIGSEMATYRDDGSARQRLPSGFSVIPSVDFDDGEVSVAKPSRPSSPGQSSITTTIVGGTTAGSEFGDDESIVTDSGLVPLTDNDKKNDHEDWFVEKDAHEHLKKLLSTVKQSVLTEMQRREMIAKMVAEANKKVFLSVYDWSRTSYFKVGKEERNISKFVVPAATPVTDYNELRPPKKVATPKIRPHTAAGTKRKDSNQTSTNDSGPATRPSTSPSSPKAKRPMSSPAKLVSHFNFKFSSDEKEKHLDKIRERFEEIGGNKALQLHNQLLDLEKRRRQRMEIKFESLGKTNSMHRDLKQMRRTAHCKILSEKLANKKKSSTQPCDWYATLVQNLPHHIVAHNDFNVIMQKLEAIAIEIMDDVQKISPDAFLRALRTLRSWELCSPDVSSAVEFVRDVVVRMDTAEFDQWRATKLNPKEVIIGSDSKPK